MVESRESAPKEPATVSIRRPDYASLESCWRRKGFASRRVYSSLGIAATDIAPRDWFASAAGTRRPCYHGGKLRAYFIRCKLRNLLALDPIKRTFPHQDQNYCSITAYSAYPGLILRPTAENYCHTPPGLKSVPGEIY